MRRIYNILSNQGNRDDSDESDEDEEHMNDYVHNESDDEEEEEEEEEEEVEDFGDEERLLFALITGQYGVASRRFQRRDPEKEREREEKFQKDLKKYKELLKDHDLSSILKSHTGYYCCSNNSLANISSQSKQSTKSNQDQKHDDNTEKDTKNKNTSADDKETNQIGQNDQLLEDFLYRKKYHHSYIGCNYNTESSLVHMLNKRSIHGQYYNTRGKEVKLSSRYLPNVNLGTVDPDIAHQLFVGQFSVDGQYFLSGCQDQFLRIYDTNEILFAKQAQLMKEEERVRMMEQDQEQYIYQAGSVSPIRRVLARDVGWSIIDAHLSPDNRHVIYSSWDPYLHMVKFELEKEDSQDENNETSDGVGVEDNEFNSTFKKFKPVKWIQRFELEAPDSDDYPDMVARGQRIQLLKNQSSSRGRMQEFISQNEKHEKLALSPSTFRFCPFSIRFSPEGKEILCGCSDYQLYIYNLERRERTHQVPAHSDDINAVSFASSSSSDVFLSGSDDGLCKVWDKRQLPSSVDASSGTRGNRRNRGSLTSVQHGITTRNNRYQPCGVLPGHHDGICHIDSKGDGRFFISNSKDQTIKLWDIRKMKNNESEKVPLNTRWDYRLVRTAPTHGRSIHKNDMSVQTFCGHRTLQTLIRAYFSPQYTTGQQYIYCGSHCGSIYIYDILTGNVVKKLEGHDALVRDVSFHPYLPLLLSSSWDETLLCWMQSLDV